MTFSEPWRLRCPNGHCSWFRRDTSPGIHHSKSAETRYRCEACDAEFDELIDAKTGEPRRAGV